MVTPQTKTKENEYIVRLRRPHTKQEKIRQSRAKRKIVKAGRRGGKTVIAATICVDKLLEGLRPLYATPTSDQLETWWFEVKRALAEPIDAGVYKKNETEHTIEREGTKNRIKGKTAWNADTLRGDYSDFLVLDEYQLMNEDTWEVVGAPMLLDNNGDAMFIYTPPSLRSAGVSKARDPRHAAKMFQKAREDKTGRWETFHFASRDNPYISEDALAEIIQDMTPASYRQEILAEDDELQTTQLVYGKFNESVCKVPRFPIPLEWPRYTGHDFGGANPAALFFAQVKLPLPEGATPYMRYGDFVAYKEYLPGPGYSTAQHVEKFKTMAGGATIVKRAGGSHQEEEVREAYRVHGWKIQEPEIRKVLPQVDRVIGLMELNKLFVFEDLYRYLEELENCLWERDAHGVITNKIQDEQRYHLCACARYILSDFTPETVIGKRRR